VRGDLVGRATSRSDLLGFGRGQRFSEVALRIGRSIRAARLAFFAVAWRQLYCVVRPPAPSAGATGPMARATRGSCSDAERLKARESSYVAVGGRGIQPVSPLPHLRTQQTACRACRRHGQHITYSSRKSRLRRASTPSGAGVVVLVEVQDATADSASGERGTEAAVALVLSG